MRLYRVVILVNIALATGYLFGYHWWGQEIARLRRELAVAKQIPAPRQGEVRSWSVRGIVRGVAPERGLLIVTHEPIPGVMAAMTMGFRAESPKLLQGLTAGDRIQFTLKEAGNQLVLVAVHKDKP